MMMMIMITHTAWLDGHIGMAFLFAENRAVLGRSQYEANRVTCLSHF